MGEQEVTADAAVRMIVAAAPDEDRETLDAAIREAGFAALRVLEEDLRSAHLSAVDDRHVELVAFAKEGRQPLAPGTWQFVLAHLAADMQRVLGSIYRELDVGLEAAMLADGEQERGLETLSRALVVAEDLMSDLPYTTIERASAPDDYELRRRRLSQEIQWYAPDVQCQWPVHAVQVLWRDGYESHVAAMVVAIEADHVGWLLEIDDPAPGRSVRRIVPRSSEDLFEEATRTIDDAIAWAQSELGDRYTFVSDITRSDITQS
jgi:hypothetical protein